MRVSKSYEQSQFGPPTFLADARAPVLALLIPRGALPSTGVATVTQMGPIKIRLMPATRRPNGCTLDVRRGSPTCRGVGFEVQFWLRDGDSNSEPCG